MAKKKAKKRDADKLQQAAICGYGPQFSPDEYRYYGARSLVGLSLHQLQDGKIVGSGMVIGQDGPDYVLIEWENDEREPYVVRAVQREVLLRDSQSYRLYSSKAQREAAYSQYAGTAP